MATLSAPGSGATTSRLSALQSEIAATPGIDGWLIYDFRGLNPMAAKLLGLPPGAHLTRRWFCWVPREGRPQLLHSVIEAGTWKALSAGWEIDLRPFMSHEDLDAHLRAVLAPGANVAMEYSPNWAVPYVSRVDGGTLEKVRGYGVNVVSSADILQRFLVWTPEMLAGHLEAVEVVMAAQEAAFQFVHDGLKSGEPVDELSVQALISGIFAEHGLVTDAPAIVGFAGHAGDPHFSPNAADNRVLQRGDCVLIDLWAQKAGCPFADITWMGSAGEPSAELTEIWTAVRDARDAGLDLLSGGWKGREGWEIYRAAHAVLERAGYAQAFVHRLGHDLGLLATHGDGANLDDLETHDTRKLTGGLGTSVEPGVYLPERGIGVRTEVNVYYEPETGNCRLTTPAQRNLYVLGDGDWETIRATAYGD